MYTKEALCMKETFLTFVLFDNLNDSAKDSFEELFKTFDIKYRTGQCLFNLCCRHFGY